MPRVKKPAKVKEPIRLRMKDLANGNKSLYLDIYRDGKRTYEYLKMFWTGWKPTKRIRRSEERKMETKSKLLSAS